MRKCFCRKERPDHLELSSGGSGAGAGSTQRACAGIPAPALLYCGLLLHDLSESYVDKSNYDAISNDWIRS